MATTKKKVTKKKVTKKKAAKKKVTKKKATKKKAPPKFIGLRVSGGSGLPRSAVICAAGDAADDVKKKIRSQALTGAGVFLVAKVVETKTGQPTVRLKDKTDTWV